MKVPTVRVVYLTDPSEARGDRAANAMNIVNGPNGPNGLNGLNDLNGPNGAQGAGVRALPLPAQVPLALLAAVGERVAESAARMQAPAAATATGTADAGAQHALLAEAERLERFGLQLQELAHVAARAQQLRHEAVDLGLALVQTVAEWSTEADRLGVELHGPTTSEAVHANPAALKHLLDLMVEHGVQQGRAVRLEVDAPTDAAGVRVTMVVSSEPASQCPAGDTLAWSTLKWFARSLALPVKREIVDRGERLTAVLPRS